MFEVVFWCVVLVGGIFVLYVLFICVCFFWGCDLVVIVVFGLVGGSFFYVVY